MKRFELICIDMFQTLVDVDSRISFIWRRILKEYYTEKLGEQCGNLIATKIYSRFHGYVTGTENFLNLKTMFEPFFIEIAEETGLNFNPKEAVQVFLNEHGKAAVYEDTYKFFEIINDSVPICLVSDADEEMIIPLLKILKFDNAFISERVKSYKNEPQSRIFKEVLKYYEIDPQRVIHIGDSSSDIIGANKVGITSCWINRNNWEWKYSIKPDYIIKSLDEIGTILDLNRDDIGNQVLKLTYSYLKT